MKRFLCIFICFILILTGCKSMDPIEEQTATLFSPEKEENTPSDQPNKENPSSTETPDSVTTSSNVSVTEKESLSNSSTQPPETQPDTRLDLCQEAQKSGVSLRRVPLGKKFWMPCPKSIGIFLSE